MVKLRGPGLAADAAGQLAGELVFSHWKGKAYLKKRTPPKQPRAPGQVATRAMMTFLSSQWSVISASDRATWDALAAQTDISPVNAYHAANLSRWRDFLRPSQTYPPPMGGDIGGWSTLVATGLPRAIRISFTITYLQDIWGAQIHHVVPADSPMRWNNLRHVEPVHSEGLHTFVLRPFEPGPHCIAFGRFLTTGDFYDWTSWRYCTVTD